MGDLTICDFSGVGLKEQFDFDKNNISCILVNTDKGVNILEKIKGKITLIKRPREEAFEYEPQLNHPYEKHHCRYIFMKKYRETHDFELSAKIALTNELLEYRTKKMLTLSKIKTKIKSIIPNKAKCVIKKMMSFGN